MLMNTIQQARDASMCCLRYGTAPRLCTMHAGISVVAAPMLRFARRQGADAARLPFRGTLAPGGALRSAQAPGTPPPVWFVFPGACPSL